MVDNRIGAERREVIRPDHDKHTPRVDSVCSASPGLICFCIGPGFWLRRLKSSSRARSYSSITWNVLEYLALFLIVMLHEFGHALACRQVGGTANRIVLWPLGGVAYVNPPQRPGATLWSIAAGPLVNVAFLVILSLLGTFEPIDGVGGRHTQCPCVLADALVH